MRSIVSKKAIQEKRLHGLSLCPSMEVVRKQNQIFKKRAFYVQPKETFLFCFWSSAIALFRQFLPKTSALILEETLPFALKFVPEGCTIV